MAEDTVRLFQLCKAHTSFLYPQYEGIFEIVTARHESADQFYAGSWIRVAGSDPVQYKMFRKGPNSATRNGALQAFYNHLEVSINNATRRYVQSLVRLDGKEWKEGFKLKVDSDHASLASRSPRSSFNDMRLRLDSDHHNPSPNSPRYQPVFEPASPRSQQHPPHYSPTHAHPSQPRSQSPQYLQGATQPVPAQIPQLEPAVLQFVPKQRRPSQLNKVHVQAISEQPEEQRPPVLHVDIPRRPSFSHAVSEQILQTAPAVLQVIPGQFRHSPTRDRSSTQ